MRKGHKLLFFNAIPEHKFWCWACILLDTVILKNRDISVQLNKRWWINLSLMKVDTFRSKYLHNIYLKCLIILHIHRKIYIASAINNIMYFYIVVFPPFSKQKVSRWEFIALVKIIILLLWQNTLRQTLSSRQWTSKWIYIIKLFFEDPLWKLASKGLSRLTHY